MADIHFDLTESATRRTIFGKLTESIENDIKRNMVGRVVGDMSIPNKQHYHNVGEVSEAIDRTVASDYAKEHAKAIYAILAEAEAQVHGCAVEETHFHEVGEGMTIRTILGICTAVEILDPEKITATAVQVGSGQVECSHGILDIPAPATKAILDKYQIPVVPEKLDGELCTPTSAAILAHYVTEYID